MRRRKLLVLAGLVAVIALVLWFLPSRVSKQNYKWLQSGMSAEEVEAIMGSPSATGREVNKWVRGFDNDEDSWDSEHGEFVSGGSVGWKEFKHTTESEHKVWLGSGGGLHVTFFNGCLVSKEWVPRTTWQMRLRRQWRRWFP
jgi:hypothetical protein